MAEDVWMIESIRLYLNSYLTDVIEFEHDLRRLFKQDKTTALFLL